VGGQSDGNRGRFLREGRIGYLTAAEREKVATFLERLAERCGDQIARVIFFGSRARGDHDAESDIDLLVVTRNGKPAVEQAVVALMSDEPYLSVLVFSAEDYREHQRLQDPLYVNLRRDGIELWDPEAWLKEERTVKLDFREGEPRTRDEATKETIRIYLDLAHEALEDARYLREGDRFRGAKTPRLTTPLTTPWWPPLQ